MQQQVRTAAAEDIPGIVDLVNDAFVVEEFFKIGTRTNAAEIAKMMTTGYFLVATDEAGLAAAIFVEVRGEHGYFGMLSVDPKRQRSGLGGRLMTMAEERCRAAGCTVMDLSIVNLREELPAIYGKRGYVVTGTAPFPDPTIVKLPVHFITMSKPLR